MSSASLTKQYILDSTGKPIGVILSIEEYQVLTQSKQVIEDRISPPAQSSLHGVLRHLGGTVAPTDTLDKTRRELWSAWNRSDAS